MEALTESDRSYVLEAIEAALAEACETVGDEPTLFDNMTTGEEAEAYVNLKGIQQERVDALTRAKAILTGKEG